MPTSSPKVIRLHRNLRGRDFIVGDLHGCKPLLMEALKVKRFDPYKDRVFATGDLVDRGPDSPGTLLLLKEPWFHSVRGNHELVLQRYLQDPDHHKPLDPTWLYKTFPTVKGRHEFAEEMLPLLREMPDIIDVGARFWVIHAELLLDPKPTRLANVLCWNTLDQDTAVRRLLVGRDLISSWNQARNHNLPWQSPHTDSLPWAFCGHSIVSAPLALGRQIYLDGGAFLGCRKTNVALNKICLDLPKQPKRIGDAGLLLAEVGPDGSTSFWRQGAWRKRSKWLHFHRTLHKVDLVVAADEVE